MKVCEVTPNWLAAPSVLIQQRPHKSSLQHTHHVFISAGSTSDTRLYWIFCTVLKPLSDVQNKQPTVVMCAGLPRKRDSEGCLF